MYRINTHKYHVNIAINLNRNKVNGIKQNCSHSAQLKNLHLDKYFAVKTHKKKWNEIQHKTTLWSLNGHFITK